MRGSNSFRPHERLRHSQEYQRLKGLGRRVRTSHFTVNVAENALPYHRLGLVVQKRFWCAVGRNRIKRQLREWFRLQKKSIPLPAKDIVVMARPGAEKLSSTDLAKEFLSVFSRQNDPSR